MIWFLLSALVLVLSLLAASLCVVAGNADRALEDLEEAARARRYMERLRATKVGNA